MDFIHALPLGNIPLTHIFIKDTDHCRAGLKTFINT